MAYWITAYCTKSLSPLAAEHLQDLVERLDFMTIAEDWLDRTEEYGEAVARAVRVEPVEGVEGAFFLYYDPDDPDWWIRFDRRSGTEARDPGLAIAEEIDGTEPGRIREVLSATEDHVAFDLNVRDTDGIGLCICYYLAMDLAERGSGLVQMDWGNGGIRRTTPARCSSSRPDQGALQQPPGGRWTDGGSPTEPASL